MLTDADRYRSKCVSQPKNYRYRRLYRTSNSVNASRYFKEMDPSRRDSSGTRLTSFWPMAKPIWGKLANDHYVAQLLVRTISLISNGVNPSGGFSDMHSSKCGQKIYQIWHDFAQRTDSYGANRQMKMALHNFRSRQFLKTSNGGNSSMGFRDMRSLKSGTNRSPVRPPETLLR